MTNSIYLNLAVEDLLSEVVLKTIIKQSGRNIEINTCYNKGGYSELKRKISAFNNAAKITPFLVLTDLDQNLCPSAIIQEWLKQPQHPNLLFRIAVKEVEAWVLADRERFAKFLGIKVQLIPVNVDLIPDPKTVLINLVRKSKNREIRDAIIPRTGSTAKVGPDYNNKLADFVINHWRLQREHPPPLSRGHAFGRNMSFP
jgi:hypothetical protein